MLYANIEPKLLDLKEIMSTIKSKKKKLAKKH